MWWILLVKTLWAACAPLSPPAEWLSPDEPPEAVAQAYARLFPGAQWVDPWVSRAGRVALPLACFSTEQTIHEEWAREGLDTPARREKAVTASGPLDSTTGQPVYLHFLGADARLTDLWGTPDTVVALLGLARSWFDACARTTEPALCTLQVGDLAWYEPASPDPLGHHDHDGTCVDVRLFRDDGGRYEAWWNRPDDRPGERGGYSRSLTASFIAHARAAGVTRVLFNDPEVLGAAPARGHDDHVHICW